MAEETRRDRRVKIVSLNVRYKSATVDEFIENHSHDVSRGGIFVKTTNPFAAGTLLKFEIRLADDQSVMSGVGRVVWRREPANATPDAPPGMGVKFIKLEDESKVIIERIVKREDAGKSFDAEPAVQIPDAVALKPVPSAPPSRKATAIGLGAVRVDGVPQAPPLAKTQPSAVPHADQRPPLMFPEGGEAAPDGGTKNEPTVMRQAAEFLEEALKGAGGTSDDGSTNPLFSGPILGATAPRSSPTVAADPSSSGRARAVTTETETLADSPRAHQARREEASQAERFPTPPRSEPSSIRPPPPSVRPPPYSPIPRAPSVVVDTSEGTQRRSGNGGGSNGLVVGGALLVAALAGAGFMFRDKLFADASSPSTTSPAQSSPTPKTEATAPPKAVEALPPVVATAPAAPTPAPSGAASAVPGPAASPLLGAPGSVLGQPLVIPVTPRVPLLPTTAAVSAPVKPSIATPSAPAPAAPTVAAPRATPAPVVAPTPAPAAPPPAAKQTSAIAKAPPPPPKPAAAKPPAQKAAAADSDNPY